MPEIPGSPEPIVSPQAYNTFSGTYNGSGVTQLSGSFSGASGVGTSGTAGGGTTAYSGLYRIERQTLDITYYRSPKLMINPDKISLSAAPTIHSNIFNTRLMYNVRAMHEVTYSTGVYQTSSYVENQKFRIAAQDTDEYGLTYGELSAGGELTMGVAGEVITEVPYYSRTLVAADHDQSDATSSGMSVYNFAGMNAHRFNELGQSKTEPATAVMSNKRITSINPANAGGWEPQNGVTLKETGAPGYSIMGGYLTTKESDTQVKAFVDSVGALATKFNSLGANTNYYDETPFYNAVETRDVIPAATQIQLPGYDASRHSWD